KRNYVFQQSQANNQENTRFAELTLNAWLNKAGYRRAPDQFLEDAFPEKPATTDCGAFAQGAVIADFKPAASTKEVGLCLRYHPRVDAQLDCPGNAIKKITGSKIDHPFVKSAPQELSVLAIKFVPDGVQNKGTLQCKNVTGTATAFEELLEVDA